MLNRKVFKIVNSKHHVIGFCWARSYKEAGEVFCREIAPPLDLIDELWKTKAYFLAFKKNELKIHEYQNYFGEKGAINLNDNDLFDNDAIYKKIKFRENESGFISLIKIYKTGDVCKKSGSWYGFNNVEMESDTLDEGEPFKTIGRERAFWYFVATIEN